MLEGKFIQECKNRFICIVAIDEQRVECYVSSSSRLENFVKLNNKKVFLIESKAKNRRTQYTLQATMINGRKTLLNLNDINNIYLHHMLKERHLSEHKVKREVMINNYKTDFLIEEQKRIIEVKGILSSDNRIVYPLISCGRVARQLEAIRDILKQGYLVEYAFVLMNPCINEITIDDTKLEIKKLYKECLELGMIICCYEVRWYRDNCSLKSVSNKIVNIT